MNASELDTSERVVDYCRQQGLVIGSETDIKKLIETDENLDLIYKDLGDLDAYIKKRTQDKYEIAVNSKHAATRQKYSMAHEYAHYLLHKEHIHQMDEGEQILHRSEEKNPIERQANNFAAEILMPEETFRETVVSVNGDIAELALAFGVSQIAVRYRAKNLGMKGHGV